MVKRHAKIAVLGQNLVVKGIEKLIAETENGRRSVTASDLSRLLDVAVKVERLSRGEPTEISELGASEERTDRWIRAVRQALGFRE
jgi:hypothetical protein